MKDLFKKMSEPNIEIKTNAFAFISVMFSSFYGSTVILIDCIKTIKEMF